MTAFTTPEISDVGLGEGPVSTCMPTDIELGQVKHDSTGKPVTSSPIMQLERTTKTTDEGGMPDKIGKCDPEVSTLRPRTNEDLENIERPYEIAMRQEKHKLACGFCHTEGKLVRCGHDRLGGRVIQCGLCGKKWSGKRALAILDEQLGTQ